MLSERLNSDAGDVGITLTREECDVLRSLIAQQEDLTQMEIAKRGAHRHGLDASLCDDGADRHSAAHRHRRVHRLAPVAGAHDHALHKSDWVYARVPPRDAGA